MPYKNKADKLKYDKEHNKNRVNSLQAGKRVRLRDKNRTYVCELCGQIGKTSFHEYNSNPHHVIEVCDDKTMDCCHFKLHNNLFNEEII